MSICHPLPAAGLKQDCLYSKMASSVLGLLTGEVYFKIGAYSPLHFSVQADCTDTQIIGAAVVPSAVWEKTGALGHCVEAALRKHSSFGMCLEILPWLICDVELITTFATPPPLLPSQ